MAVEMCSIIKVSVLGFAALVCAASTALPWWFKVDVPVSRDGGRTMETKTLNVGLFFMDQGKFSQTDLIFIDKTTNAHVVPDLYKMAQLFFGAGSMGLLVCFGTSIVYLLRRFTSATGEICLAGAVSPCAFCLVIGIVFAFLGTLDGKWEQFPVPNYYILQEVYPTFVYDFAAYIAAGGAMVAIIAAAIYWMHACQLCSHVETARYQMLTAPLTDDERGVGGTTYQFNKQNPGFRYDGYSKPAGRVVGHALEI